MQYSNTALYDTVCEKWPEKHEEVDNEHEAEVRAAFEENVINPLDSRGSPRERGDVLSLLSIILDT